MRDPGISLPVGGVRADQLSALLARVEAAAGPDRELDVLLWLAVVNPPGPGLGGHTLAEAVERFPDSLDSIADWWAGNDEQGPITKLTASLDASLALCERVLPGRDIRLDIFPDGGNCARIEYRGGKWSVEEEAETPALALLAAMLSALIAQGKDDAADRQRNPGKP